MVDWVKSFTVKQSCSIFLNNWSRSGTAWVIATQRVCWLSFVALKTYRYTARRLGNTDQGNKTIFTNWFEISQLPDLTGCSHFHLLQEGSIMPLDCFACEAPEMFCRLKTTFNTTYITIHPANSWILKKRSLSFSLASKTNAQCRQNKHKNVSSL